MNKLDRLNRISAGFNEATGDTKAAQRQRGFKVLRPGVEFDITPPKPDPELEAENQMQMDAYNAAMEAQEMRRGMSSEQELDEEQAAKLRALEGLRKLKEAQMQGQMPEHLKALVKDPDSVVRPSEVLTRKNNDPNSVVRESEILNARKKR